MKKYIISKLRQEVENLIEKILKANRVSIDLINKKVIFSSGVELDIASAYDEDNDYEYIALNYSKGNISIAFDYHDTNVFVKGHSVVSNIESPSIIKEVVDQIPYEYESESWIKTFCIFWDKDDPTKYRPGLELVDITI